MHSRGGGGVGAFASGAHRPVPESLDTGIKSTRAHRMFLLHPRSSRGAKIHGKQQTMRSEWHRGPLDLHRTLVVLVALTIQSQVSVISDAISGRMPLNPKADLQLSCMGKQKSAERLRLSLCSHGAAPTCCFRPLLPAIHTKL